MFIHGWYVAAWADEVTGDTPLKRTICGNAIVMFRTRQGRVGALEDRCCHRAAPLHLGKVVEQGLQCGYHGLIFDCAGACVRIPAQDRIPDTARVRSFPMVEKNQVLWIWIGPPEAADESLIIDYPWHDDAAHWPHKRSMYHVDADYMLLVDNVMDLTHIGYVHEKTIG
ncbi:MAG: Rieske 2Fe-2S domain-containing protein, partial [Desulfobacterales bacterium]|nr:Rieske 2Fe-2S domain-containing protein [Desulfobacterales bacterium]